VIVAVENVNPTRAGVQIYAQLGQDQEMKLLRTLIPLFPSFSSARK
jgi:hypothetical protein